MFPFCTLNPIDSIDADRHFLSISDIHEEGHTFASFALGLGDAFGVIEGWGGGVVEDDGLELGGLFKLGVGDGVDEVLIGAQQLQLFPGEYIITTLHLLQLFHKLEILKLYQFRPHNSFFPPISSILKHYLQSSIDLLNLD